MGWKRTKKSCTSCGFSHIPPTGKKCEEPEAKITDGEEEIRVAESDEEAVGNGPTLTTVMSEAIQTGTPLMTSVKVTSKATAQINDVERKLARIIDGMETSLLDINTKLDMFLAGQVMDKKPRGKREPPESVDVKWT